MLVFCPTKYLHGILLRAIDGDYDGLQPLIYQNPFVYGHNHEVSNSSVEFAISC